MVGEFKAEFRGLDPLMRKVRGLEPVLAKTMHGALIRIMRGFRSQLEVKQLSGRPGLMVRSGALRRSFNYTVSGNRVANLEATFFTTSKYAPVHEFGATIRAKNKPWLMIPIRAGGAAFSSKIGSWRRVKQVYIPPRLQMFSTWSGPQNQVRIQIEFDRALSTALGSLRGTGR